MNTTAIEKLNNHISLTQKLKLETIVEFKNNLKLLFENNPSLKEFTMHVNNHEFNDGEPTYYSIYYDDVEVVDISRNKYERNSFVTTDPNRNREIPIVKAVYELFNKYDVLDIYETMFSGEYDRDLTISRNNLDKYIEETPE